MTSLKAAGQRVGLDLHVQNGHLAFTPIDPNDPRYSTEYILPSMRMVEACRAEEFDFFQPFLTNGRLTIEQMKHAAGRYHLGKTKSGQPLFWMIDEMLDPLDAHIRTGEWLSTLLKVSLSSVIGVRHIASSACICCRKKSPSASWSLNRVPYYYLNCSLIISGWPMPCYLF